MNCVRAVVIVTLFKQRIDLAFMMKIAEIKSLRNFSTVFRIFDSIGDLYVDFVSSKVVHNCKMALCEADSYCLTSKASTGLLHRRSLLRMLFFSKVNEHLREKHSLNVRKASHSMDLKGIFKEPNMRKIRL